MGEIPTVYLVNGVRFAIQKVEIATSIGKSSPLAEAALLTQIPGRATHEVQSWCRALRDILGGFFPFLALCSCLLCSFQFWFTW